jgi:hypothetical protein
LTVYGVKLSEIHKNMLLQREVQATMRAARLLLVLGGLGLVFIGGCWHRLYPPIAEVELLREIYPDSRPRNCKLTVLNGPPAQPYDVFAQIVSYAGSVEMADGMESLIKAEACQSGADAIVLLPLQEKVHYSPHNMYPDWVINSGLRGEGGVARNSFDKRYAVSQRALALVFKREHSPAGKKP